MALRSEGLFIGGVCVNLISVCKYPTEGVKKKGVKLFSLVPSERTRGHGHKVKHRKFHLNFFFCLKTPVRVVRHRNGLSTEVTESLSLEILKTQLDAATSNLLPLTLL